MYICLVYQKTCTVTILELSNEHSVKERGNDTLERLFFTSLLVDRRVITVHVQILDTLQSWVMVAAIRLVGKGRGGYAFPLDKGGGAGVLQYVHAGT